ncbi:hypothetical protein [Pedobacter ureilyticus]|uniref:Uncharacterized protein n=1 Tax=Pedobacter ureilyticus TaxID=1393051 RepID=A0ABW9J2M4_9SPHI|nr:hypothetical protein [Pedobacter helvus]
MLKYTLYLICLASLLGSCQTDKAPLMAPEYLYDAKNQQMISSSINSRNGTISLLYGKDETLSSKRYSEGANYTLVTWKQKPMPGWYGTNMNSAIYSVETMSVQPGTNHQLNLRYQFKTGPSFDVKNTIPSAKERINFILTQPKAVQP